MYGLLNEADSLSTVAWQKPELDRVVKSLAAEFPTKTAAELEHVVEFCKGAVRRYQGREALQEFASALLRNVEAERSNHRADRAP